MPITNQASYEQSYNSFSGVDMHVSAGGEYIGEVQGISYTVTREKAPLYTMGSADPRSFSRGKRGIAGSMIFLVLDRSALLQTLKEGSRFLANGYEVDRRFQGAPVYEPPETARVFTSPNDPNATQSTEVVQLGTSAQEFSFGGKVIARARYHDQILPFNIVITASNEYGFLARMEILNVEIMNCGSGMSIDDITTDESCTFVATSLVPWFQQRYVDPYSGQVISFDESPGRPRAG